MSLSLLIVFVQESRPGPSILWSLCLYLTGPLNIEVIDVVDWQYQVPYGGLKLNYAQLILTKHEKNVDKMAREIFTDIFVWKNSKDYSCLLY
ncbi:hypothetical protein N9P15_02875 [Planktomarina sp.]|nr:hypothetical protein [Planktomarina sp.]